MKKILITGCSGYIGSHLCKMLENDYEIHGLDIKEPQVPVKKFYQVDINRLFTIPDQTEPYDAVIHLAALVNVGESEEIPIMYYITNLNGTMNVLNKIPTHNFIFASTGAAVGCESAYGISKRAAEDCVREYCTKHNPKNFTTFRFYNVIGSSYGINPTNPDGLMYNLLRAKDTGEFTIFGTDYQESRDGTPVRDYVHVLEICTALKLAIETPSNKIESLGHGVGYTVNEMVEIFKKVNNCDFIVKDGPRRKGDTPSSVLEDVSPYMTELFTFEDLLKIGVDSSEQT
jgi:UDP-glucose 4-epimerase